VIEVLVTLAVLAAMFGLTYLGELFFGSQDALPPIDRDHKPAGHVRIGIDWDGRRG